MQDPNPNQRFLLIDTDAGTDDAWALFLALQAHKQRDLTGINIVAITTVCGNAAVQNVSINVTRTLDTVQETSIPIYQGMTSYMTHDFCFFRPPWCGRDGFGDAGLPPITARLQEEHAVMAIVRLAKEYQGKLEIVALGPLTNLAAAVKLQPEIKTYLKEIFVLNRSFNKQGSYTAASEFNFSCDPEAAAMCIDTYTPVCKLTVVPWETCLNSKATESMKFRMDVLGIINTPQIQLLNAVEAKNLKQSTYWLPADAIMMSCVVDPKIVFSTQDASVKVELDGKYTRGMLVVCHDDPPNVAIITEINVPAYESSLIWAVSNTTQIPPQLFSKGLNCSIDITDKTQPESVRKNMSSKIVRAAGRKLKACRKVFATCVGE